MVELAELIRSKSFLAMPEETELCAALQLRFRAPPEYEKAARCGFLVIARYRLTQCSSPVGKGAISAKTGLSVLAQSSMPMTGIVDWFAPTVSHRWLARPSITLPLGPQPAPTLASSAGRVPDCFDRSRSSLVPRLPPP